ncbi:RHS repeat-associated core domain-containing protein [Kitasatospora sp. NPDC002227]|uniref:RHS repeat domain-containing protein n=1 Tax=Kitasatospora sp. NPDC002227 TaxID=3154773 RepID=UPI00331E3C6D
MGTTMAFSTTANAVPPNWTTPAHVKVDLGKAVTGLTRVPHTQVKTSTATNGSFTPSKTAWPAEATASLDLAAPKGSATGAKTAAPGTPVWAQAVASPKGSYARPTTLGVSVKSHDLATKLGISGVVWSLADNTASAQQQGSVRVGLDYGAFSQAIGGNYASRLHLVQLPACALTTPELAKCRVQTPLASVNDPKAGSVSAEVPVGSTGVTNAADTSPSTGMASPKAVPAVYTDSLRSAPSAVQAASTSGAATVIAATDSTGQEGGAGGTYASTGVSSSGSWSQSGSSGDFTYSYKVQVPGASTSLAPDASLAYDSGSVDGKTSNTQAQSSWVGDGWETQNSAITQHFVPCSDSPEGSAGSVTTSDECYDGQLLSLSLNGSSTSIVYDSSGKYRLADDSGATVSHLVNQSNGSGTYNTDYWVITERNGTSYYFGRNQLPGWSSGKPVTNSVDYERVYAAHSTDPCYNATPANSYCTMAYQWHLDYVTTVTGAAMSYYYTQDTNYYGANNGANNGASAPKYVRDSYLNHIDYGFTTATGPYGTVPDKVLYTPGVRCVSPNPCGSGETSSNAASYPDVPFDLICAQGATCSSFAPSFFSTVRLSAITTQQYSVASSGYVNVDSYAFTHTEPDVTDKKTSATLWLDSVLHTGYDTTAGGSTAPIPTPPVSFAGSALENRVDTSVYPGMFRYRITAIKNELGGTTGVTYKVPQACSTAATPSANTGSCFPVYWTPKQATGPMLDWFNKWAVQQVLETDTTGGSLAKETDYDYLDPAWHYDDNELVQPKYRTYGQWHGYRQVTTTTGNGAADAKTAQVTTYYQGMDGDYLSPTSTRTKRLSDSQNGTHTDSPQLTGKILESTAYLGNGGAVDHSTITSYWISPATATRARTGLPDLTATMTGTAEVWSRQRLTDGGQVSWRYNETDTTYDANTGHANFGLPLYSYAHTVPANTAYDRCTSTTYAPANTGSNLVGLVAGTEVDSVACAGFTEGSVASVPNGLNTLGAPASVSRPAQVVSASQTFYDDATFSTTFPQTTAPTMGLVTMARQATTYSAGAFTWRTGTRNTYDSTYHRLASATDGNGNTTNTGYTVNTAYLTTGQSVTQPTVSGVAHVASTTLDPERGLVLTSTDVNGVVTTTQYDALGRPTSVWASSRPTSSLANQTYTYTMSNSGVSGVVTNTLNDNNGYLTSVSIQDSLGRARQTQTHTPQGGRLINDTLYDSRGWTAKKNNNYWDSATTPTLDLMGVPDSKVANQDVYTYDGLGRAIYDQSEQYGSVVTTTTSVYNGDATTVIPPTGGVTKTTKTDPAGRTSELDAYSAAPTLTTPANTTTGIFYLTGGTTVPTTYGFDGHGNQATTTDAKGDVWTSTFDLAREVTSKADPTAGTSTMSYDAVGNLLQTQDSRGTYVSTTYDALNRKTGRYAAATSAQAAWTSATAPGNQTAAWVYDNANAVASVTYPIGHVTTATSYFNGNPYTQQAVGFNVFGKSLGEQIIIPSAAQGTLLGKTWKITHGYSTTLGLLGSDGYLLGGGLPAETVVYSYNNDGLPYGLGTTVYSYVQATTYTAYGQVAQTQLGDASVTKYSNVTNTYDPHTGALKDQLVTRSSTTPATVDDTAYTYDLAGNPRSQTETRLGSSANAETQCFTYDALDRLTTAWTATDQCAATPTAANHSTVGDGITGGAYWTDWTFDAIGNRQTQNQHALAAPNTDNVTTSTYSITQPNTLTGTSSTTGATTGYTYDTAGNTYTRNTPTGNQNLTWNNEGELTQVANTTTSKNTNYIYDADGRLLLQIDPATTTLYLGSEQITLTGSTLTGGVPTGGTLTGVRYYSAPGGATIARTGTGTNYNFELGNDRHGTGSLTLDSTAQTPTWRQFDPYGNPRGTAPSTWIDNRTFLNKPTDTVTGLTNIGARYYDSTLGRFISLDPIFESSDSTQLGGYSYAGSNPVVHSDPSGLRIVDQDSGYAGGSAQDLEEAITPNSNPEGEQDTGNITRLNSPKLYFPKKGSLSQEQLDDIGQINYRNALDAVNDYVNQGYWNTFKTVVVSQVDVDWEDGLSVPRTVAFVNQGFRMDKYGQALVSKLSDLGVTVIQRELPKQEKPEDHAETAARMFRGRPDLQNDWLQGNIAKVKALTLNNYTCGPKCGESLTEFVNDPDIKMGEDVISLTPKGQVVTKETVAKYRQMRNVKSSEMSALEAGMEISFGAGLGEDDEDSSR